MSKRQRRFLGNLPPEEIPLPDQQPSFEQPHCPRWLSSIDIGLGAPGTKGCIDLALPLLASCSLVVLNRWHCNQCGLRWIEEDDPGAGRQQRVINGTVIPADLVLLLRSSSGKRVVVRSIVTEAIGFLVVRGPGILHRLLSHVSTAGGKRSEVPSLNFTSTSAGSTSWFLLTMVSGRAVDLLHRQIELPVVLVPSTPEPSQVFLHPRSAWRGRSPRAMGV